MKKNKFCVPGMLALALGLGLAIVSCNSDDDGDKDGFDVGTVTISKGPGDHITMNVSGWNGLSSIDYTLYRLENDIWVVRISNIIPISNGSGSKGVLLSGLVTWVKHKVIVSVPDTDITKESNVLTW